MERYDYFAAVKGDVKNFLGCNVGLNKFEDRDSLADYLNDVLWTEDSVTGNGSGSYTFNAREAEEYLCHNWGLLAEAMEEFGCTIDKLGMGPKWADVTIRCYLLGRAISEVLNDMEEAGELVYSDSVE